MKKNLIFLIVPMLLFISCDKNNNLIFFSIQNDKDLGAQVAAEIAAKPNEFPILSESQYQASYNYLEDLKNDILNSGQVQYKDDFEWELKIIHDDNTLNAFATPGGYIFVYTGLIKYLDNADDLAGVLGHEIAHADLRHTSRNLQTEYGVSILLSIILGENASELETIAAQIATTGGALAFSRKFESEADENSVIYLAKTDYACNGAASFFAKLIANGQDSGVPQFLSTHPNPDNRVEAINDKSNELACDKTLKPNAGYAEFKATLPQ